MKMPIKYIHAECLNFLKCALMYGKKKVILESMEKWEVCACQCVHTWKNEL